MSVINGSVINFAQHKTFRSFVILYALMTVMILLLLSTIYYQYSKKLMLSEHRLSMQLQSEQYVPRLKAWMQGDAKVFPIDLAYPTALFDANRRPIHSLLQSEDIEWNSAISLDDNVIHFVIPLASYELGESYLVFETQDDGLWRSNALLKTLWVGAILFTVLLLVGWYLSHLFFRPLRDAIALLDDFIKDTTHELNTPVSAIMTNLEMIDRSSVDSKTQKKMNRIEIAAKTISTIYDDLTYLLLNSNRQVKSETINISELLYERIEYFNLKAMQKNIHVNLHIESNVTLECNQIKLARMIDNLISNAIKYNKNGGSIIYELTKEHLIIKDSGIGIAPDDIGEIFKRYTRANSHEGGFGIGLHIVFKIANEYGYKVDVNSKLGEGSSFEVIF